MSSILTFGQSAKPDEINVSGVTVILYDATTKLYGCLHDTANPGDYWLITGGLNEDEDPEDCVRREVLEEVGYSDIEKLIPIVPLLYSRYRPPRKGKDFRGEVRPFIGIMNSLENNGATPEEHEEGFEPIWVTVEDIRQSLLKTGEKRYGAGGYDHRLFLLDEVEKITNI